jgi:DNA adenine methylase
MKHNRTASFFRYPGGKAKLRQEITARLLKHNGDSPVQYREPFFGGGSIGIGLLPAFGSVWINDKDVGIACLWTAVIRHREELKERVRNVVPAVGLFDELRAGLLDLSKMPRGGKEIVEVAWKKLAIHQVSYSGLGTMAGGPLGGRQQRSPYKIDSRWRAERICEKVDAFHCRLASLDSHRPGIA